MESKRVRDSEMEEQDSKRVHKTHSQLSIEIITAISKGQIKLNVCKLSKRAYKLINKSSSSETSIAFGKLIEHDTNTALKMFLNNERSVGIAYETEVYKYIIDRIIVNNYSPNFIPYLGIGSCRLYTLAPIFKEPREYENLIHQLSRFAGKNVSEDTSIGILVTEVPKGQVMSFHSVIDRMEDIEIEMMFVQILYSLGVMNKFRITHNDMHMENILVSVVDEPINMCFVVKDKKFFIRSRFIPYFFDWDNSYCEMIGKNKQLNEILCRVNGMCNTFSERKDLFKVACSIINYTQYESTFKKFLKSAYGGDVFDLTVKLDTSFIIPITREHVNEIRQHVPFVHDIVNNMDYMYYRMSKHQLAMILGSEESLPEHSATLMFFISKDSNNNYQLDFTTSRPCDFRNSDETYPTPLELLLAKGEWTKKEGAHDLFSKYLVDEIPLDTMVYTMPTKQEIQPAINYDSYTESTRYKIQGKPAVPIKKKSPVYVSTEIPREKHSYVTGLDRYL